MPQTWQLTFSAHYSFEITTRMMCCPVCVCLQPVFHLGLPGFNVSNLEGAGATQITLL
jgi:hypothetical protein